MTFADNLCLLYTSLPKRRMAGAHKVDYPRTLRAIGRNRHLLYRCV